MCPEKGPKKVQGVVGGGDRSIKAKSILESLKVFSGMGVGYRPKFSSSSSRFRWEHAPLINKNILVVAVVWSLNLKYDFHAFLFLILFTIGSRQSRCNRICVSMVHYRSYPLLVLCFFPAWQIALHYSVVQVTSWPASVSEAVWLSGLRC